MAEPGPFCSTPAQACIARMFVWVLEREKSEGGLHGEFSACVFGWAQATSCCGSCVCAFDTASKHPVTFLNRHVAAVCGVAREERANWRLYPPNFTDFFVMVAYNCRRLAGTALQQLQRIANRDVTFSCKHGSYSRRIHCAFRRIFCSVL